MDSIPYLYGLSGILYRWDMAPQEFEIDLLKKRGGLKFCWSRYLIESKNLSLTQAEFFLQDFGRTIYPQYPITESLCIRSLLAK